MAEASRATASEERPVPTTEGPTGEAETTAAPAAAETETVPGPDAHAHAPAPGVRATRFRELYAKSLASTLKKLRWELFADCYPTIARRAEGVLRQVQEQMVTMLRDKCEKAFESIMSSRLVVVKLNELEGLIGDAAQRREDAAASEKHEEPTPPHTLPPSTILAAHLHPALAEHTSHLHARLQTTQAQNRLLADAVRQQRAEVDDLLRRLEDAAGDVRGANEALDGVVAALAEETRMDAEHV